MIGRLRVHHAICGSYDLCSDSDADLREWQRRLLDSYRSRGSSARLKAIEEALPELRIGLWTAPNEKPVIRDELEWWSNAAGFAAHTHEFPAFRGSIDPKTSAAWCNWAHDQIEAAQLGKLSSRQRGELLRLGLLANKDQARSRQRALTAATIRNMQNAPDATKRGQMERDMNTFLGTCLLIRLMWRQANAHAYYSTLCITPIELSRINSATALLRPALMEMNNLKRLGALRELYNLYPIEFDRATTDSMVPAYVTAHLPMAERQRMDPLLSMVLEIRTAIRKLSIEQSLPDKGAASVTEEEMLAVT